MFRFAFIGLVLVATAFGLPERTKPYSGHSVIRVVPQNENEVEVLKGILGNDEYDVWKSSRVPQQAVDVRVSPAQKEALLSAMDKQGLQSTMFIDDVQKILDDQEQDRRKRATSRSTYLGLDLESYNSYDEIQTWLSSIASSCSTCSLYNIGSTHERRDLTVIKIGSSSNSAKRSIFIDCGIHAREWIAPATCLTIIHRLVTDTDDETTALLRHYDFYILPLLNPDGYEYSMSSDRLWRKNRKPNSMRYCMGVDLNRNFDYYWGVSGTSTDPCSDLYGGPHGASEPETQNVQSFLNGIASTTDMYLSFHSYGQMWLNSWGYTSADAPDSTQLENIGKIATTRLRSVSRTRYRYGSAAQVLYASAGGSDDWAKGSAGIKYSFTVELRDTGRYGFVLPERLIRSTAVEAWEGTKAAAMEIKRLHPNGTR